MKKFEKYLRYAEKFEAFQTARKSKEVNDIQKLDTQKEFLKTRKLKQTHLMDRVRRKHLKLKLEVSEIDEQHWETMKRQQLGTIETLEAQARHTQVDACGSEFDLLAEMQGERYNSEQNQEFKQLPEISFDPFVHELTEITKTEHQKELEKNEKAIWEPLKPSNRLELTVTSQKSMPETDQEDLTVETPQKTAPPPTTEFQPQSGIETNIHEEENEISQKKDSPQSVFFFRPISPPRK